MKTKKYTYLVMFRHMVYNNKPKGYIMYYYTSRIAPSSSNDLENDLKQVIVFTLSNYWAISWQSVFYWWRRDALKEPLTRSRTNNYAFTR